MKLQSRNLATPSSWMHRLRKPRDPIERFLRTDFIRHGALVFAAMTLVNLFNYVFHFLLSRRLGVSEYGALASLMAALVIASVPSGMLTLIVVKYTAEFKAVGDQARLRTLSDKLIVFCSVLAIGAATLGYLLRHQVGLYLKISNSTAIIIVSLILGLNLMVPAVRGILQGLQDFKAYAISTIIEAVGKAALGVTFVYMGLGLTGAVLGYVLASTLSLIYTVGASRANLGVQTAPLFLDLRRLLKTSGGVFFYTAGITSLGFLDLLLVKHYFVPHNAGIYSAISLIGKILLFVVGFVPTVVLPKATALATGGKNPISMLIQAGIAMAVISISGLAVLWVFPVPIVAAVVGRAFVAAAPYLFSYGCAMTLLAITTLVATYKIALHRFDFVLPIVVVPILEIVGIAYQHHSLFEVIRVLLVGHTAALIGTLYRINADVPLSIATPAAELP